MTTVHFEGPQDEASVINARIAASKPFTRFLFHGLFLIDTPLILKGGGRSYSSYKTGAVLQKRPGVSVPVFIQVVEAHNPPQPWDWLKQLLPRSIRRFLHLWIAHEVGASVRGFFMMGDGQGTGIDVRSENRGSEE